VLIFVNHADFSSGNFIFHEVDGKMWSQKNACKEVVGIPIRYFDATIAFVSCNLSSNEQQQQQASHRRNSTTTTTTTTTSTTTPNTNTNSSTSRHQHHKATNTTMAETITTMAATNTTMVATNTTMAATNTTMAATNTTMAATNTTMAATNTTIATTNTTTDKSIEAKHFLASSLIHSFGMNVDRADMDFPYLYHHTFLSGNLNYDIDQSLPALYTNLEQAYKAECLKRGTDLAMDIKLEALRMQQSKTKQPPPQPPQQVFSLPLSASGLDLFNLESAIDDTHNENTSHIHNCLVDQEQDQVYKEIYSYSNQKAGGGEGQREENEVPFVIVQSPHSTVSSTSTSTSTTTSSTSTSNNYSLTWESFLEAILPTSSSSNGNGNGNRNGNGTTSTTCSDSRNSLVQNERKQISDLMEKSRLVSENTERKWQELVRYDQLRAAMEAKEIFCGFEEPPITFLPSYPRKVGTFASYFTLARKKCRDFFQDSENQEDLFTSSTHSSMGTMNFSPPPAYKDRILVHSLPDTRPRLRNIKYWLCEEILVSTHKPICSVYEMDIDRLYAFKNKEADTSDFKQGIHALKDKHDMKEYRIQLFNLDANIWTYRPHHSHQSHNPLLRRMMGGSRGSAGSKGSRGAGSGGSGISDTSTRESLQHNNASSHESALSGSTNSVENSFVHERNPRLKRSTRDLKSFLSSMRRKKRHSDRSISRLGSSNTSAMMMSMSPGDSVHGGSTGASLQTLLNMELVPVDPVSISTVFPLPSEDVVALQRKMYEVAHAVNNGFQAASSGNENGQEEAELAYTNFRTVSWQEALKRGVKHVAITRAVNSVLHIAIKITAEKDHGGHGILCIHEQDILQSHRHQHPSSSSSSSSSSPKPIPFDVMLTWGGKHVGYLHGDILVTF
jgi:hypothetical protein